MKASNSFSASRFSTTKQCLLIALIIGAVTLVGFLLTPFIGYKVVAFMLLIAVSIVAMLFDIWPVLLAAALSALIWDFFFIPPRFTFRISTAEDSLMLLMYFVVAMVNAALTYKIRQVEKEARKKEEKARTAKFYSTLLNSLSHELRTPIATVIGASDNLAANEKKLSEQDKAELVHEISVAAFRLNQQVENLLNMSRIESGMVRLKKDWCDVSELVYAALNRLPDQLSQHKVEVKIRENLPLFQLDFVLMEQVLYNLVLNAALYTPPGSVIRISADSKNLLPEQTELPETLETHLLITVSDNGPGFPENEIKKAFGKFYRLKGAKPGGTGLGLAIVKGFVEAHDGTIRLENKSGAQFQLELPAAVTYINALKNE